VINGQRIATTAKFAAYLSLADAFTAHAKMLATGQYMAHARACLPDVHAFCMALGGGTPQHPAYSTDPNYGATLWSIIQSHQLTGYDA
jgi:flagellum-specific peptidoglycan hydrolase FlgJ